MKKITALVVLALLAVAGIGYSEIGGTVQIPPVSDNPLNTTVIGLRLQAELAYNEETRPMYFVPIKPCRLSHGNTLIPNGEVRKYAVTSSSNCSWYVPTDAVAVAVKVTALGIANYSPDWGYMGATVDILSPNSITDSGSGLLGDPKPAFVYFQTGVVASGSGIADLEPVSVDFATYTGLWIKVAEGEARVAIDILGYFVPRQ